MKIAEDELGDFHAACKALMKTGRVVLGSKSGLTLPEPAGKIVGVFRANPRGFGFVIPDTPNAHGDLYVPAGKSGGAVTGDTVSASVRRRRGGRGDRMVEGEVVAILKRGQSQFVGRLRRELKRWFVIPDGNTLHAPIMLGDVGAKGAKAGDQVVVEIIEYPTSETEARGVILRTLGKPGEPEVDTQSIIAQYGIPVEFPDEVLEDARRAVAGFDPKSERKRRESLDKITIITIDPTDARDFDDAISLTQNPSGTVELGVHIADVSYFVPEGGPLDDEARERSTSAYFPSYVVPMLPELLSNGVCSLQEKQWRLTKSVFIAYDRRGKVRKTRFANTVIRSTKRLTYNQATRILDDKPGRASPKVVALLHRMDVLAKTIRQRRIREGMLVLDLPEVKLVLDDRGKAIDAVPADTSFSHTIIEMFMVEANEAVCRLFAGKKVPHLRRVHDEPSFKSLRSLQQFLRVLGHPLPADADRPAMQKLLGSVRGEDVSFPVNLALLRSMQKAEYSPQMIGHFALASANYTHFTSPIRRYPDLIVHRLLDLYIAGELRRKGGRAQRDRVPDVDALTKLGQHCSTNERRAESAERELRTVKILRLLAEHLGDQYEGVVTGVANFGIYVQLDKYLIDGVLRFADLPDDWWEVDAKHGLVVGERSGRRITIGDRLTVVTTRIEVPQRELELGLAEQARAKTDRAADRRGRKRGTGKSRRSGARRRDSRGAKRSHG